MFNLVITRSVLKGRHEKKTTDWKEQEAKPSKKRKQAQNNSMLKQVSKIYFRVKSQGD